MVANPTMGQEPTEYTPLQWLPKLLKAFISRSLTSTFGATHAEPKAARIPGDWFEGTIMELCGLPWDDPDWTSENPQPLDAAAVAELLLILLDVLPEHALAPNITPNWDGGAMATWLLGGLTLEIETRPGQPAQYCYGDERGQQDLDDEGDVSGNEERLRRWAKVLADAATELGL